MLTLFIYCYANFAFIPQGDLPVRHIVGIGEVEHLRQVGGFSDFGNFGRLGSNDHAVAVGVSTATVSL